jgi:divalent metal cation (Fe/Co/Zn/Cd) transporter
LADKMTRAVAAVPGVVRATPVRLRESGHRLFADVVVTAARTASLAEAHDLTERIESAVRAIEPRTETLVHVEPISTETETAAQRIRAISLRLGLSTHHEAVYRVDDHFEASLHLEVAPQLPLREAYSLVDHLVAALKEDNASLERVDTHIEVAAPAPVPRHLIRSGTQERASEILRIVAGLEIGARCHEVRLYQTADESWGAVLHCDFDSELPMRDIHRRTERIEYALRQHFPDLEYALVQSEPEAVGPRPSR